MYRLRYSFYASPAPKVKEQLAILAVGQFRTEPPYECLRPRGWNAEHLILTTGGAVAVTVNGQQFRVADGSLLLTPKDSSYTLRSMDDPGYWEGYWVEYNGAWARELWRRNGLNGRFHVHDNGTMHQAMEMIFDLFKRKGPAADQEAAACLVLLLARAGECLRAVSARRDRVLPGIEKAREFVRKNLDKPIGLPEMAGAAGISKYHFLRMFRERTGFTPARYILSLRISRARELFRTSQYTISEVAHQTGFSTLQHFSAVFKRETGLSPRVFVRSLGT